jgi:hypothetical protein
MPDYNSSYIVTSMHAYDVGFSTVSSMRKTLAI